MQADEPLGLSLRLSEAEEGRSDLEGLAHHLSTAGVDYRAGTMAGGPAKGSDLVTYLAISLVTLRSLVKTITPVVATWLNRPRHQKVVATLNDGREIRSYEVDVGSAKPADIASILDGLDWLAGEGNAGGAGESTPQLESRKRQK
jgi:hypothetical protein